MVLLNNDEEEISDYDEVVVSFVGMGSFTFNLKKLYIDLSNREATPVKPSIIELPKSELKVFYPHPQYIFLGVDNTLLLIIVNDLEEWQVNVLINV